MSQMNKAADTEQTSTIIAVAQAGPTTGTNVSNMPTTSAIIAPCAITIAPSA